MKITEKQIPLLHTSIIIGAYILFYLGPILVNPFAMINILEAAIIAILMALVGYLNYTSLYTNKFKTDARTINTIVTIIILAIVFLIYFNPISFPVIFNVIINRYLAIALLLIILGLLLFITRKMKNSFFLVLVFTPQILQGILVRISYNALLFYIANPNFTLYLTILIFIGYYLYNRRK